MINLGRKPLLSLKWPAGLLQSCALWSPPFGSGWSAKSPATFIDLHPKGHLEHGAKVSCDLWPEFSVAHRAEITRINQQVSEIRRAGQKCMSSTTYHPLHVSTYEAPSNLPSWFDLDFLLLNKWIKFINSVECSIKLNPNHFEFPDFHCSSWANH